MQKNATGIKYILSRVLPQLNFLIILNFGAIYWLFCFPRKQRTEKLKQKILSNFGPKRWNGPVQKLVKILKWKWPETDNCPTQMLVRDLINFSLKWQNQLGPAHVNLSDRVEGLGQHFSRPPGPNLVWKNECCWNNSNGGKRFSGDQKMAHWPKAKP